MMRRGGLTVIVGAVLLSLQLAAGESVEVPPTAPVVWCTRFSIEYTVRDIGSTGPKKVEFYITEDMGKSWRLYGEDPDARSPMVIKVQGEGVYGFMSVGTDYVGNRERPPVGGTRPEMVVVVDRTPPSAKWIEPSKTELLKSEGITFAWESSDSHLAAAPVAIEYSSNEGNTWLPLKERLPAKGRTVLPVPSVRGAQLCFRLVVRDRAGNRRILTCPHRVLMDRTPPTVGITGPLTSGALDVDVTYVAQDNPGGTGIDRISLMYTVDNGEQWHEFGDDTDVKSPIRFSSKVAGTVGLMLVAYDKVGNHSPLPRAGTPPPFTIDFDNEAPQVAFDPQLPDGESVLRGGRTVPIRWRATDANIRERSAMLYYSRDGGDNWELVAKDLPVNGPYSWKVPNDEADNCLLKVSVADTFGKRGEVRSLRFKIDSVPPELVVKNIREAPEKDDGPVVGTDTLPTKGPPIDPDDPGGFRSRRPESMEPSAQVWPANSPTEAPAPVKQPEPAVAKVEPTPMPPPPTPTPTPAPRETPAPILPTPTPTPDKVVTPEKKTWLDNEGVTKPSPTPKQVFPVPPPLPDDTQPEKPAPQPPPPPDESTQTEPPPPTPPKDETPKISKVVKPEPTPTPVPTPPLPPADTGDPRQRAAGLVERAERLSRSGQNAKAVQLCQQAARIDPASDAAHGQLSRYYFADGKFPEAAAEARAAIRLKNTEPTYWMTLGDAYYRQARMANASYSRQARVSPADPQVAAMRKQRDQLIEEARRCFIQVSKLRPKRKEGYDRLGDVIYFQALTADFDLRELGAGDAGQRNRYYRETIQAFSQGYAIEHVTYREAFHLGVSHYRLNELEDAQRYLERAIEEAKDVVPKEAFWYLAEIHQKKGELEDALRYWEKTVESYPEGDYRDKARDRLNRLRRQMPK